MKFIDIELTDTTHLKESTSRNMQENNENMPVVNDIVEESLDNDWDNSKQPLMSNNEDANNDEFEINVKPQEAFPKTNCRTKMIYLVDVFFSAFVSSPLSGFFWYTIWKFTESYVFIYSRNFSYFICYFIGFMILALAYLLQDCLQNLFNCLENLRYGSRIFCFLMRNIYMYIITVAITIEWQGLWDLIESNVDDLQTKLCFSVIGITYACLTRSTRALVSTPFVLTIDDEAGFFEYELKTHSIFENSIFANFVLSEVIDCLVMVVGWIGFDNLYDYYFDSYLSPEISYYSLFLTFTTSHLVYFIVALLQIPLYKFMSGYTLILRIVAEHIVNIVMFISSILLWKFYWDLGDFFLDDFDDKNKISIYFIGNTLAFMCGIALRITWLMPGPGVITFDGDNNNQDAYFEIDYFSTLLKKSEETNISRTRVNQMDL